MIKQINQNLAVVTCVILFSGLIFFGSCRKGITRPDTSKPGTGSSKIVYTDVNPDTTVSGATYDLDLNNDGIADFKFYAATVNGRCPPGVTVNQPNVSYVRVSCYNANSYGDSALFAGGAILPLPIDSGRTIDQDLIIWGGVNIVGDLNLYNTCSTDHGFLILDTDKYLPLRLVVGSSAYFGWVRVSIHLSFSAGNPSFHFTIKDYAYNSIPNQPILAGQIQ